MRKIEPLSQAWCTSRSYAKIKAMMAYCCQKIKDYAILVP